MMYHTECNACKTPFAMSVTLEKKRRQDGKTFYCPNGHGLVFSDSENERLKKQVAKLKRENQQLSRRWRDWRDDHDRICKILVEDNETITLLRRQKGYYQGRLKMLKAQLAGDEEE